MTRCIHDVTRILAQYPEGYQGGPQKHMGPIHEFHWWAEPEVGYADSTDKWYLRRNIYYMNMAGVDYLYLDFTNGYIYEEAFELLLDTCLEMRAEGLQTPSIVPWCYANDSGTYKDLGYLYRRYYLQEKYRPLWFYMNGKPLACLKPILDDPNSYKTEEFFPVVDKKEIVDFFTFRMAWTPNEGNSGHLPGEPLHKWSWNCPMFLYTPAGKTYNYGWDEDSSKAEQMCIGVGGYCNIDSGRSGTHGTLDRFREKDVSSLGLYIEDQFEFMMQHHPETRFLTIQGWNEWVAQFFPEHIENGATSFGFVDQYNREFGRDMEPTKGGYTDNYFYQLCSIVRRFKGMEAPAQQENHVTIDMGAGFDQWQALTGTYDDYYNDVTWRDDTDPTGKIHYVNQTGRNDIVHSKVAYDEGHIYFYVETAQAMTSYTDKHWMLLFIDADDDAGTGWEGYDYLVNYNVLNEHETTICRYVDHIWQEIGVVSYVQEGNQMQIAIPRSLIGQTGEHISFGFHWNDNVSNIYSMASWFVDGDNAPERRNMYVFSADCVYDVSAERKLPPRATTECLQYMKAADKTTDGLIQGLMVEKYIIAEDYGKQPEIWLLANADGSDGNRIWRGVKQEVALVEEEPCVAYATAHDGYIMIPQDASATFTLCSDDGAMLYINDRCIIDNGGVHIVKTSTATIKLAAGLHKFRVEYFENGNGNSELSLDCDAIGYQFYCEA